MLLMRLITSTEVSNPREALIMSAISSTALTLEAIPVGQGIGRLQTFLHLAVRLDDTGDLHLGCPQPLGLLHPLIEGGEDGLDGAEGGLFAAGGAVDVGEVGSHGVKADGLRPHGAAGDVIDAIERHD